MKAVTYSIGWLMVASFIWGEQTCASFVIDSYETTQELIVYGTGPSSASSSASGPGILGGERDMYCEILSGDQQLLLSANKSDNSQLAHGQDIDVSGFSLLVYDGGDGNPEVIDYVGLGGFDLTIGDTQNLFQLDVIFGDVASRIVITVYSNALDAAQFSLDLPNFMFIPVSYFIPYADFTPLSGTGADFTSVGAIVFRIEGATVGLDLSLEGLTTGTTGIGDFVWLDPDLNGIQDQAEAGLGGVAVSLYEAGGGLLGSLVSDEQGSYSFLNIAPGNYTLHFLPPAEYLISPQDQGTDDRLDSDADPLTGYTAEFAVGLGEITDIWDAGFFQPTPTLTPTESPTLTPTMSPTETPTWSPTLSPSHSPTETPTETPTLAPTATSSPSYSPTETSTLTPTESPTFSPTSTASPSHSPTETPTESPSITPTLTPSSSPSWTPSVTPTESPTMSPSVSPTWSPTTVPTETPTMTATRTASPTVTSTVVQTETPTASSTSTPTRTQTATATLTLTMSPSVSPTQSSTLTPTRSATRTPSWSPTVTHTASATRTPASTPSFTLTRTITPEATATFYFSPTSTVSPMPSPTTTPTCSKLEVYAPEVTFDPPSASPGEVVQITIPVHNIGIYLVEQVGVYVAYDEFPYDPDIQPVYIATTYLTDLAVGTVQNSVVYWDTAGLELAQYPIYIYVQDETRPWCEGDLETTDYIVPVTLAGFEVIPGEGSNCVEWITITEINNVGFVLYRSTDYFNGYSMIHPEIIPGAGTSYDRREYRFEDGGLMDGVPYFYKLGMVDARADIAWSRIVAGVPQTDPVQCFVRTWTNRVSYHVEESLTLSARLVNHSGELPIVLQVAVLVNQQYVGDLIPPTSMTMAEGIETTGELLIYSWQGTEPLGAYTFVTAVWDSSQQLVYALDVYPIRYLGLKR